jgi:proteasome accessory factor B
MHTVHLSSNEHHLLSPNCTTPRLEMLLRALPASKNSPTCRTAQQLLERLPQHYLHDKTGQPRAHEAALRMVQRDIESLSAGGMLSTARIRKVEGSHPPRYYRIDPGQNPHEEQWNALLKAISPIGETGEEQGQPHRGDAPTVVQLQERMGPVDAPVLGRDRLRFISDSQHLQPALFSPEAFKKIIEAMLKNRVLSVNYRVANPKPGENPIRRGVRLHIQALLQRGPRVYVLAYKEISKEDAKEGEKEGDCAHPIRMYALHRILNTPELVEEKEAWLDPDFSLDQYIAEGKGDFAPQGKVNRVCLVLRARGYLADLLTECPLSSDQITQDEPEGSSFDKWVCVPAIPSNGQLWRWLLGFGQNVEVLEPPELREALAREIRKMQDLYPPSPPSAAPQNGNPPETA